MLVALRRAARVDEFKESRDLQRQWARNFLFLLSGTKERPPIPPEEISRRLAVICSDSFKSKNRSSIAFLYREVKGFVEPAGSMVIDCS